MKRIALVNQRCGKEVNGGSEAYTMQIAQKLSEFYRVDLITTTANDYKTWKNHYKVGTEYNGKVRILRFSVKRRRNVFIMRACKKLLEILPCKLKLLEFLWVEAQGPYCPDLIKYIKNSYKEYSAYVFVTYLYYHTVRGLLSVSDKAILIPTAHDEYPIYYNIYQEIFKQAKAIGYLTEEEKHFTESLFSLKNKPGKVVGVGIDRPHDQADCLDEKIDYIIYVGRVDQAKGCDEMFRYFIQYKSMYPSDLKLILVGKAEMEIPRREDIISMGFVDEKQKYSFMANAKALILPSEYESLSLSVLESLGLGVPVLVNAKSKVLEAHCRKSEAGLSYHSTEEFIENLRCLLTDYQMHADMSEKAKKYIDKNYSWNKTISALREMIEL